MSVEKLKLSANPLVFQTRSSQSSDIEGYQNPRSEKGGYDDTVPQFVRYEETTNIELFYDLFFVANLTSFGTLHEINSKKTLTTYLGFFMVLWFTWCQCSLFDVRYVIDSLVERITRALHLGVMVGLAVVGPNFDTIKIDSSALKAMALILMASRIVLTFQYLLVLWHVRRYRNTGLPLVLIALSNFLSAMIYLGISFTFKEDSNSNAYRIFYVLAVFEVAVNIIVSSKWKVVSFKGSHLVQRMSLLTLIILGEGIISICKTLAKIVTNDHAWTQATIGTVVSAVIIIYLCYMLYFDSLYREHFGSVRQQIWAFLHFPFHLSLVLYLEGTSQFVVWHKMTEAASLFAKQFNSLSAFSDSSSTTNSSTALASLNSTIQSIFQQYPPVDTEIFAQVNESLVTISEGYDPNNDTSSANFENTLTDLVSSVVHSIFESYGFEAGEDKNANTTLTPQQEINADNNTANLVGVYFFIAAGLTLLLIGILGFITVRSTKGKSKWIRLGVFSVLGSGLTLLASMVNTNAWDNFGVSAWVLPVVAFCYSITLVLIHVFPKYNESAEE